MSKYNKRVLTNEPDTINLAGGRAHEQSADLALVSLLLTSFTNDKVYEKEGDERERLREYVGRVSPFFAARAAIYARREFGMRSVSHLLAAMIGPRISGATWAAAFYDGIVHRVDDMLEIGALVMQGGGKLSNAMKKGFAAALGRFDDYQLAKYRGEDKVFKLVDLVNLVHPVPNERNQAALNALVDGTLKNAATWEAQLSAAGQVEGDDEAKAAAKSGAWADLIESGRIGYFALLRNLRNILTQAPEMTAKACGLLVESGRIKKSLVLPFRFMTAYDEVRGMPQSTQTRLVLQAINTAVDLACSNVPALQGETLVVLDTSGSMGDMKDRKSAAGIGALFSAVMLKAWNCDMMSFSDDARYEGYNPSNSTIGLMEAFRFQSGGTNFHSIFQVANKRYDRIVILSDMQGWVGHQTPAQAFQEYKRRMAADPFIYSFDLRGYGTMQFPEKKVAALAGFSDKVFELMGLMEQGPGALIGKINAVELQQFL